MDVVDAQDKQAQWHSITIAKDIGASENTIMDLDSLLMTINDDLPAGLQFTSDQNSSRDCCRFSDLPGHGYHRAECSGRRPWSATGPAISTRACRPWRCAPPRQIGDARMVSRTVACGRQERDHREIGSNLTPPRKTQGDTRIWPLYATCKHGYGRFGAACPQWRRGAQLHWPPCLADAYALRAARGWLRRPPWMLSRHSLKPISTAIFTVICPKDSRYPDMYSTCTNAWRVSNREHICGTRRTSGP
jgi:hypothetical protein